MARWKTNELIHALVFVAGQLLYFVIVVALLRITIFPEPPSESLATDWAITLGYGALFIPAMVFTIKEGMRSATSALAWCLVAWLIGQLGSSTGASAILVYLALGGTNESAILVYLALGFTLLALDQRWMAFFSFAIGIFGVPVLLKFGSGPPTEAWQIALNLLHSAMVLAAVIPHFFAENDHGETQARPNRQNWTSKKAA